ncbi:hypothetical protein GCM10011380_13320 [Sphingomonas metalli]|uniref:Group 1 truncated hemoglobin n=1 Tax=Sphingomonas metalli TaxID=1779358 RepID=A0A916SZP5_9SPHN|nr:group 1 truncated hemoglobin [Sphingomonas metalli]GGB25078.1 hypothetical protein GCM10011380_13320 [Sphingomonas metalli]
MILTLALSLALQTPPGEESVAPYARSDANAGATPFPDDRLWRTFGAAPGVARIVDRLVELNQNDPRIADIFKGQDLVRLRRVLKEQFCYILGGGCTYSGRDMKAAHHNMGLQTADMAALVENLQRAMRESGVPFAAQNQLLAKLAPMKRVVVTR